MSISITTVNLKDKEVIDYRTVMSNGKFINSLNINQTDGSFVTTEPLENSIVVYPQSPNNPSYETNSYGEFSGYGTLDMPLDARFDYIRRKMFIADAGNGRVLKVGINSYDGELEIEDLIIPHSVIPELNLGGFFIKSFSGINSGTIYYHAENGELVDYFTYPCDLGHVSTEMQYTAEYIKTLPLSSSMVYDHVRWRLWWTSGTYIYMMDIRNRQVVQHNLSPEYIATRGIDVEFGTGNSFAVVQAVDETWRLLQVFRDNNMILDESYLDGVLEVGHISSSSSSSVEYSSSSSSNSSIGYSSDSSDSTSSSSSSIDSSSSSSSSSIDSSSSSSSSSIDSSSSSSSVSSASSDSSNSSNSSSESNNSLSSRSSGSSSSRSSMWYSETSESSLTSETTLSSESWNECTWRQFTLPAPFIGPPAPGSIGSFCLYGLYGGDGVLPGNEFVIHCYSGWNPNDNYIRVYELERALFGSLGEFLPEQKLILHGPVVQGTFASGGIYPKNVFLMPNEASSNYFGQVSGQIMFMSYPGNGILGVSNEEYFGGL